MGEINKAQLHRPIVQLWRVIFHFDDESKQEHQIFFDEVESFCQAMKARHYEPGIDPLTNQPSVKRLAYIMVTEPAGFKREWWTAPTLRSNDPEIAGFLVWEQRVDEFDYFWASPEQQQKWEKLAQQSRQTKNGVGRDPDTDIY